MNEKTAYFCFYSIFRKCPNFYGNGVCTFSFCLIFLIYSFLYKLYLHMAASLQVLYCIFFFTIAFFLIWLDRGKGLNHAGGARIQQQYKNQYLMKVRTDLLYIWWLNHTADVNCNNHNSRKERPTMKRRFLPHSGAEQSCTSVQCCLWSDYEWVLCLRTPLAVSLLGSPPAWLKPLNTSRICPHLSSDNQVEF